MRKRLVPLTLLLACLLSTAAFTVTDIAIAPSAQAACPPPDPEEPPCGGGGTGGGGGTPTTYRVVGHVGQIGADGGQIQIRGWSRFEANGVKIDADTLFVRCIAGTGQNDEDFEEDAGFTDVEFDVGPMAPGVQVDVICGHRATYNGVTYTAISQVSVLAPL